MNKSFRLFYLIFILFLTIAKNPSLWAQTPNGNLVSQEVVKLSNDPILKYGQLALSIQSLKTGQPLVSENAIKNLAPASNLKLLTTAAALKLLGEDYVFKTVLEYDGELKDSILFGNLYITGGGDPTLGADRYKGYPGLDELMILWAKKIKEVGIKKINGAVLADPTIFEINATPDYWPWGDMGNYYGAPAYGLNINENLYRIYFKGTTLNDSARIVKIVPDLKDVKFLNEVKVAAPGSGDNAYIYAAPRSNFVYLKGTIPANTDQFPVRGSIPDPGLLCAIMLNTALKNSNISINGKPDVMLTKSNPTLIRKNIYTHNSPPLKDIVKQTNFNSLNINAEALLKICGVKMNNSGTTESGVQAVQALWKQLGLETTGWFMYDGSGLSANNGISASTMAKALSLIGKDSCFKGFYNSIPVAGQTGTVAKLCRGTLADGNLRIKSGTLTKAICYSGYFKSKSGEMYSFSLMVNDYNCSNSVIISRLEKIMIKMAEIP